MIEHFCNKKPYGDSIILDGDSWAIINICTGLFDKITSCPWCGEDLTKCIRRTLTIREENDKKTICKSPVLIF